MEITELQIWQLYSTASIANALSTLEGNNGEIAIGDMDFFARYGGTDPASPRPLVIVFNLLF